MARFLAKHRNYSHGVRSAVTEHYGTGQSRVLVTALEAQFAPEGVSEQEKKAGAERFVHRGLPEDFDTNMDVSPIRNLSVFDSERAKRDYQWSDEDHDLVVKVLRESPMLEVEFFEVSTPKAKAPWAGYDRLESAEKIADVAVATETPLNDVLTYERENRNREDVIEVLRELADSAPAEEKPVVIEA